MDEISSILVKINSVKDRLAALKTKRDALQLHLDEKKEGAEKALNLLKSQGLSSLDEVKAKRIELESNLNSQLVDIEAILTSLEVNFQKGVYSGISTESKGN